MSNTLKRAGYYRTTAAIPYKPFRPAYTYTEPIYGYFINGQGYAWDNGASIILPPGRTNSPTSALEDEQPLADNNRTAGIIGYRTVTVPAQNAQAGVAGHTIAVPAPGWTSFARSLASIAATGHGSFQVPVGVSGVVIGLAEYIVPNGGYGHIKHGLLFAGDHVYEAKTGTDFGVYAADEVYSVSTDGLVVSYLRDGASMGSLTSTYRKGERLYLTAVLASVGDSTDNPFLESEAFGTSAAFLSAIIVVAEEGDYGTVKTATPALMVTAGVGEYVAGILPAMAGLSGSTDMYGAVIASLFAPTVVAYEGTPPLIQPAAENDLPVLVVTALGLTGEIGEVDASLPALGRLISETVYGESMTTLPMPLTYAYTEPEGQGFAFESLSAAGVAVATTLVFAVVVDGVTIGTTVVSSSLLDAVVAELVRATPSVATEQLLDAVARTFIRAGSTGVLEGAAGRTDLDTWVWHAAAAGSTSYSDYPFNSFATIDGKHYGASPEGLFLLEGDTDAGTPIHASFDLGELDFGTAENKTILECYLGLSAQGNIFLKVIAENGEFIYKTRGFSQQMQQQRITPGKGLRTNYITAQFFNEGGADFEIDSVRFLLADLTRRIN